MLWRAVVRSFINHHVEDEVTRSSFGTHLLPVGGPLSGDPFPNGAPLQMTFSR